MTRKEIEEMGREIIEAISGGDIPYSNKNKCQEFNLTISHPSWSQIYYTHENDPLAYSHIDLSWLARPKKTSSIIWSNIKRVKTIELKRIIQEIKRDKKLQSILQ